MTLTGDLHMTWEDPRVAATDAYCFNVSATYVVSPTRNLPWYPQWVVSNGRGEDVLMQESWEFSPVQVKDNGIVDWYMSFEFVVDCPLMVEFFPFDVQACSVDIAFPQLDSSVSLYSKRFTIHIFHIAMTFTRLWTYLLPVELRLSN